MFRGFSGHQRVAPLAERRVATQLREALATLPAPWVVLANRRASGADGPPWVRFLALHPAKGIALVDTSAAEAAKAPLEDFLARTGFPALQPGALPIVPVAIGPDEVAAVADILESVFAQGQPAIGNPNWCDAVVELLRAAPDLMLSPLRHSVRQPVATATQTEPSFRPAPQPARAEPSRPPASATPRAPTPPDMDSEAVRLVPRRVARPAESQPQPEPPPSRAATRQPHTPDVPQFLLQGLQGDEQGDEPHLALEAGEPIDPLRRARTSRSRRDPTFGAGPGHADAAWRQPRASRRRSAFLPIAAGLLLVAAGAVALRYHESLSSLTADRAAQSSPPSPTASLTPPPAPPMPSPLPTVSPTPAATVPTPPPPPAPPVHAAATPPHTPTVPSVKKADADLPRDMLQPQIVSAPPAPPPLPAAKRVPQPVRTATAKPQSTPPAPADTDLPAAIAAVLHPGAAPPPAASAPTIAAPPSATATAAAPTPAPTGGEVTVNGVRYINGQQPHALGTLGTALPSAPSPDAVASNASPPAAVVPPGEVVISRAPAATVISSAPASSTSSNAVVNGPPRGIVATPVPEPSSGSDSGNGATANGPPTTLEVAPAPGSSSP
ncbi:MAG TPA: hypothetical protein VGR79_12115 [Stellaceae bacterium]|nr:hypothetical protein [Stellaceae bacterium]